MKSNDDKDLIIGKQGPDGRPGPDGKPGPDGRPGANGIDGKNGADGRNGRDGKDGKNGVDGKTPAPIAPPVAKAPPNVLTDSAKIDLLQAQLAMVLSRLVALESPQLTDTYRPDRSGQVPSQVFQSRSIPDGNMPGTPQASTEWVPAGNAAEGGFQIADWNDSVTGTPVAGMLFLLEPSGRTRPLYIVAEKVSVVLDLQLTSTNLQKQTQDVWVIKDAAAAAWSNVLTRKECVGP